MATPPVTTEGASGAPPVPRVGDLSTDASRTLSWRSALILLGVTVGALFLLHLSTLRSMARVWTDNESFSHCWFVLPLAAYMIWTRRAVLRTVAPRPTVWGVLLVLGSGMLWFLSHLAQVSTGEQVSLVGMILGTVWALLGTDVSRRIAYPLAFIGLMVPFGEGLFPILISIAGRLAVTVLEWTGMPVTFDGRYLRVPGGEWGITEACSGLRYLLAILTVGAVFAYLSFEKPVKRALFIVFCVVASVLMNGFRVWLLVMIGALSDMKSPIVHDHEWLGWILFAIMMAVIFQIGRRAADPDPPAGTANPDRTSRRYAPPAAAFWATALAVIVLGATWTTAARAFNRPIPGEVRYAGPSADPAWQELPFPLWDWKPHYVGAAAEFQRCYERDGAIVGVYVAYYRDQEPGAELVQSANWFVDPELRGWKRYASVRQTVTAPGGQVPLTEIDLDGPGIRLRCWRTYWVGGRFAESESDTKLEQLRGKLLGRGDDAAVLILYTNRREDGSEAEARLRRFLAERLPALEQSLWYTSGRGPANASAG